MTDDSRGGECAMEERTERVSQRRKGIWSRLGSAILVAGQAGGDHLRSLVFPEAGPPSYPTGKEVAARAPTAH